MEQNREQRPQRQPGDMQRNVNTLMLGLCLAGTTWIFGQVNSISVELATIKANTISNSAAIERQQATENEHAEKLSTLNIRLSRLEYADQEKQNKK